MYSNARLQAFSSRSGVYLSQTHARLVALLLYFVAAENGLDSDLRVAADFTGPVLPRLRYGIIRIPTFSHY